MSQCRFRASEGTYKPLSQGGWHMGSHSTLQRATGRLNRSVQPPDERMGFVQARRTKGCLSTRGAGAQHICASAPAGVPPTTTRMERDPLPPTPYGSVRGNPKTFPHFFHDND